MNNNIITSNINLREEMLRFINTTKYQVLLQRISHRIKCTCYKEQYAEGVSKCPKCLGRGYIFKFTKHKVYKQDMSFGPHVMFTSIGSISNSPKTFFFEHDVHPQKGDYIWEVTWNEKSGKPIKICNLFKIAEVADMRGELGRIEFYAVYAELENIDKDFKNMYIGKAWRDIQ